MFYCFLLYMIICAVLCIIFPMPIEPLYKQVIVCVCAGVAGLNILVTMYLSMDN